MAVRITQLKTGHGIATVFEDGWWNVWLNNSGRAVDLGVLIGTGPTEDEALSKAVECMEASAEWLQGEGRDSPAS